MKSLQTHSARAQTDVVQAVKSVPEVAPSASTSLRTDFRIFLGTRVRICKQSIFLDYRPEGLECLREDLHRELREIEGFQVQGSL